MGIFKLSLVLLVGLQHSCKGQTHTNENVTENLVDITTVQANFRICDNEDEISKLYCKCSEKTVSCDFSGFTLSKSNSTSIYNTSTTNIPKIMNLTLYGYSIPRESTRFCICNSPPNLNMVFSQDHFLPHDYHFQRFDLFNLSGITYFMGGFASPNFHGDIYIVNVSRIPEIRSNEFGRGKSEPILDVQNQKCCSPVTQHPSHRKPIFIVENTTIDSIMPNGLNDNHLWKTVIFKSTVISNVYGNGVVFDVMSDDGIDVAIIGGIFMNMSRFSFVFQDSANVLLLGNRFDESVDAAFLVSRSRLNDSNVVLLENTFVNRNEMHLDARYISVWLNTFYFWDNFTFVPMKNTQFSSMSSSVPNRRISLKYNQVRRVSLSENSINFQNWSNLTLSDNVMGKCNCSRFLNFVKETHVKPEVNWCFARSCSLNLKVALGVCNNSKPAHFTEFCGKAGISVPNGHGISMIKDLSDSGINSTFMHQLVSTTRKKIFLGIKLI